MTGARSGTEAPAGAPTQAAPAPRASHAPALGPRAAPSRYTRAERLADAAIHCIGVALALMAAPLLVALAAMLDGSPPMILGVSVYGAGMVLMLGCSAAYHLTPASAWKELLRRFDHAAIYVKIAATQTPFAVMIGGAGAGWILGSVWTAALGAAAGKLFWPHGLRRRVALPLYLALGWAGAALVFPRGADAAPLDDSTMALVVAGGVLYTAGVAFFLAERLRFHNAIWHAFVLVATFAFYAAVTAELGLRAAAAS